MHNTQNDRYKIKYAGSGVGQKSWHILAKMPLRGTDRTENRYMGTMRMGSSDGGFRLIEFSPASYGPGKKLKKFSRHVDAGNSEAANAEIITRDIDEQRAALQKPKRKVRRSKYGNFRPK